MPGPISPNEVAGLKKSNIPEFVFEAFNELIARDYQRGEATVRQKDVVELICKKKEGLTAQAVDDSGWLNVEEAYESDGWSVDYDEALFTFKKKRKRSKS